MSTEVGYTDGFSMMSHLGTGKALLAMKVTSGTNDDCITTPFARCVPVLTPSVAADATSFVTVSQAAGVITIVGGGTQITTYQALIIGDLY